MACIDGTNLRRQFHLRVLWERDVGSGTSRAPSPEVISSRTCTQYVYHVVVYILHTFAV